MKILIIFSLLTQILFAQESERKPSSQNPSPMVENTRAHQRIQNKNYSGMSYEIKNILEKPLEVYVTLEQKDESGYDLLIHFHGASFIVKYAAEKYNRGSIAAATVNLGSGSSAYSQPFRDPKIFELLLDSLRTSLSKRANNEVKFDKIILSGFSAGYGAVREILSSNKLYDKIDAVLLLDGMHADYIPRGKVLYEGGIIDSTDLDEFLEFARDASKPASKKRFLFTYSEIFPGTFVSTTESADYLLSHLDVEKEAVLKWGPLGMQQLSRAKRNNFLILGFAGNTAQDHIDHLHALYYFLNLLME